MIYRADFACEIYRIMPCVKGGGFCVAKDVWVVDAKLWFYAVLKSFLQSLSHLSVTVFDPGRKYNLLHALAKNMPLAYFLNASRPLHKRALNRYC